MIETPTPHTISVGDDVQWMHTRTHRNGSIDFSTRYGKVVELFEHSATVKRRGGKREQVALRRLVPANQPSPVNHVVGAMMAEAESKS